MRQKSHVGYHFSPKVISIWLQIEINLGRKLYKFPPKSHREVAFAERNVLLSIVLARVDLLENGAGQMQGTWGACNIEPNYTYNIK